MNFYQKKKKKKKVLTVWWHLSDQDSGHVFSLRKVQSSCGSFLAFHLRESWWGGNFQSFSSQSVGRYSSSFSFPIILFLGVKYFGGF